jgi:hypothetical protein
VSRLVWILLVIVVAGAAIGGYLWSQREVERQAHPLEAIAADAPLIFEFRSMAAAIRPLMEMDYANKLIPAEAIGAPWERTMLLDSLFRSDELLSTCSGFHAPLMDSTVGMLTVLKPPLEVSGVKLREHLAACAGISVVGNSEPAVYQHVGMGLHFAVSNGLLLIADDPAQVNGALAILKSGKSAFGDARLAKVRASAGKNVQMNMYARLPSPMFGSGSLWNEVGNLLALDITTKTEGLVMNGFAQLPDSSEHLLSMFRGQQPQTMKFQGGIPADASSFLMFAACDISAWQSEMIVNSGKRAQLDSLNDALGIDVAAQFLPWMSGQFGVCRLPIRNGQSEDFAVFHVSSREVADQLLHGLAKASRADSSALRAMPVSDVLAMLFGREFPSSSSLFFARHNDFVVFGPSAESLGIYMHQLRADRTLASDISFVSFSEQFSSSFNVFSFERPILESQEKEGRLSEDGQAMLGSVKALFSSFPMFGVQISNAGESFYVNMHWRYDPDWTSRPMDEAVATMDAPANGRPKWVINHLSKELEILVQDRNNMLYLFNRSGQELFRRQFSEAMVGEAVQVDRYKNGNLQYVFSTNNFIYQLDRNGKDVDGFPLELESPVAMPMTVVDYEGRRDYRLLVACKNNRVYNYGIDGKEVKGWKFDRLSNPAATSFAYISVDRRDYLTIAENDGKLHLLDRTGARRSNVKETVVLGKNSRIQQFEAKKKNNSGFYMSDTEGTVLHLMTSGKVKHFNFGKFSGEHLFLVADLDDDGEPEFIFTDLNAMKVFERGKKLLFEQRLRSEASNPFLMDMGDGRQAVGFVFTEDEQIVLYGASGLMVDGFPLSGNSVFDMAVLPSGERVVVTGTSRGLSIHMLE